MNTHRKLILLSCITALTASFAIAEIAEAGPIGGMNAPTEVDPVNQEQTKAKPKKNAGRAGPASSRLVVAPGTAPPAGVVAPAPDHSIALTTKRKLPIPAHLDPGQILKMSVGGGIEVADGIAAGVMVTGLFRNGTLFGNDLSVRAHPVGSSPENTVQIALLPENGTQTYEYEIEVGKGLFSVAVDAYWFDPMGPARDRDELLAVGKQRSHEGKLYVTLAPDPSWSAVPTAYYVIVSRDDADWTFKGVTIARGI